LEKKKGRKNHPKKARTLPFALVLALKTKAGVGQGGVSRVRLAGAYLAPPQHLRTKHYNISAPGPVRVFSRRAGYF
jgi:hypothetical protein